MASSPDAKLVTVPNTVLVTLPSENTKSLLKDATDIVLERLSEAKTIKNGLSQLDPALAKQFKYKQDTLEKLTFRMLCSSNAAAVHGPEAQVPSFLAISYCWHSEWWDSAPAAQSMTTLGLSQPVISKILELKQSDDEGVWVDCVCIDQKNEKEKQVAIGSMDVIYRAARRLIIALEDVQLDEKEAKAGLKYADMYQKMSRIFTEREPSIDERFRLIEELFILRIEDLEDSHRFLVKILNARWFFRAWCAHEIKVNPHTKINNPLFLCFSHNGVVLSFEFRFIYFFANHIKQKYPEHGPRVIEIFKIWDSPSQSNTVNTFIQGFRRISNLLRQTQDSYLPKFLLRMSQFDCQVKTDLIAISLNASKIPLTFNGTLDPAKTESCFFIFVLLALALGDLNPLLVQGRTLAIPSSNEYSESTSAVSWVDLPHSAWSGERLLGLDISSIHAVTLEYIELDIYLLTKQPKPASETSLLKARSLIEKFSLTTHSQEVGCNEWDAEALKAIQANRREPLFLESFLASAVDNGLPWILHFPRVLETESSVGSWSKGIFFASALAASLKPAAEELLSHFNVSAETDPSKNFDDEFLKPAMRFFTYITDARLNFTNLPRSISTRASSTSDSDADFGFTTRISDRSYIAIPVTLSHLPFFENRAWVVEPGEIPFRPDLFTPTLTPRDGEELKLEDILPVMSADTSDRREIPNKQGTWCLRSKHLLVGCGEIVPDGEAVMLLQKQRIYGAVDYDWAAIAEQVRVTVNIAEQQRLIKERLGIE